MKLSVIGRAKLEDDCIRLQLPRRGGDNWYKTNASLRVWDNQQKEPITTVIFEPFLERPQNSFWLFRSYIVVIDQLDRTLDTEELKVHVKHYVFQKENKFSKLKKAASSLFCKISSGQYSQRFHWSDYAATL